MKKLFFILLALVGLTSCHNFDTDFPDFDYTSGYFPYQYPMRILVLGDYIYDNENDNNHQFVISTAIGGLYTNKKDRVFNVQVDESLCNGLAFSTGGDIKALPRSYYTLASESQIIVPKGEVNGGVKVQLNDAFFNDPGAITNTYVLPMRITSCSDVDTILLSKNFTLFGIKYVNEYHGNYFHYGQSTVKDANGATIENNTYSNKYMERNEAYFLKTSGRNQVSLTTNLKSSGAISKSATILFNFNGNSCSITAPADAEYTVSGTGTWKENAYEWGGKSRHGIEYSFTYSDADCTYTANDVLVVRDRQVTMEVFTPVTK